MIVSVSRRTDAPALYSKWIIGRIRAGHALAPSPFNRKKLTRVALSPKTVDCLVFWSKNPAPIFPYLNELFDLGYKCLFQFTLNPYGQDLEPGLPPKKKLVDDFIELSQKLSPLQVDWRYDPIIIDEAHPVRYHLDNLAAYGEILAPYTTRIIVSFVDQYRRIKAFSSGTLKEKTRLSEGLGRIAKNLGLPAFTCAEKIDFASFGIKPGACLDREKIERIAGRPLNLKKDPGQRKECLCALSVDIGVYNSCSHFCAYCYANVNRAEVERRTESHDPKAPSLAGPLIGDEEIVRWLGDSP